ncbi:MAG: hypothetical protein HY246_17345 [Proteobacteria bacterium]|nr:hypothetical protein [Pseudomonadota bacterium]
MIEVLDISWRPADPQRSVRGDSFVAVELPAERGDEIGTAADRASPERSPALLTYRRSSRDFADTYAQARPSRDLFPEFSSTFFAQYIAQEVLSPGLSFDDYRPAVSAYDLARRHDGPAGAPGGPTVSLLV